MICQEKSFFLLPHMAEAVFLTMWKTFARSILRRTSDQVFQAEGLRTEQKTYASGLEKISFYSSGNMDADLLGDRHLVN